MNSISPSRSDIRIINLRADAIDDLAEIVWRNIGGHSHGDARPSIDQKIGEGRRKNGRFLPGLVVVGSKIDRILVHVVHERRAEVTQARLGVTHGRRWIALH
jgi:hypothetical protein